MMIEQSLQTAVVLLVFRRPDCTRRVLAAIRAAKPKRLWVVADGPRADRTNEAAKVAAVRLLIDQEVDWPCDVRRLYSDSNLGCAKRVSSGLDEVFAQEDAAIILEDDCVPDPSFFRYCEELLSTFDQEKRVAVVSGVNFQRERNPVQESYYFSRYPHCGGWATWRRAWQAYDRTMQSWPAFGNTVRFSSIMSSRNEERYWRHSFDLTKSGIIDSWANRWTLTCWVNDWLTVLPRTNLISNIGFGPDATHTTVTHPAEGLPLGRLEFPLLHPSQMSVHHAADAYSAKLLFSRRNLARRLAGKLWRLFFPRRIRR